MKPHDTPGRGGLATTDPDVLLRALAEQRPPPLAPEAARLLRQRVAGRIDALALEAREERARGARLRQRVAYIGALAAVLAALVITTVVFVGRRAPAPAAAQITALTDSVEIAGSNAHRSPPVLALVPLSRDEELRTGVQGIAKASLATGATVSVGPSTRVRFTPVGSIHERFDDAIALSQGQVSVEVPKLPAGVTVSVRTPDAVVTVHGTRFMVTRLVGRSTQPDETRVSVTEGRVAIRRGDTEQFVTVGESWSSSDNQVVHAPDLDTPAPPLTGPQTAPVPSEGNPVATAPLPPGKTPPRNTLMVENRLLSDAMEARKAGRAKVAVGHLDELLRRYPDSPLAEIARVERLRALDAMGDRVRLASEARRYLRDYPHGFARAEVEGMTSTKGRP